MLTTTTQTPPLTANRPIERLRYQLGLGFLAAVVLPALLRHGFEVARINESPSSFNTLIGTSVALALGVFLFRRVTTFPGVRAFGFVMPSFGASYGLVLTAFFFLRLEYSRFYYGVSFGATLILFFLLISLAQRARGQRFYVVPAGETMKIVSTANAEWVLLQEARVPDDSRPVFVADLRADLDPAWERLIAEAALAGYPVYHSKLLWESLTGRVEIEHLSENSFGTLIPNHSYRKFKRAFDLVSAIALLPVLVPPALVIGLAIKLGSPGPVFFKQRRMGYRGKHFSMIKFRTMRVRSAPENAPANEREEAVTRSADERITPIGRFLRRTRIDELPQILNILKGDMSWIGPRPEAVALSEWYEAELPFYAYRHVVRPGISGWAQVNQGHVAELSDVHAKLHYDFYYIKNFSAWLDWLIVVRTVSTVVTGFGSK